MSNETDEIQNKLRTRIRNLNRIITGWQKHIDRMATILGCVGMDQDVEEAALKLQAELSTLRLQLADYEQMMRDATAIELDFTNEISLRRGRSTGWRAYKTEQAIGGRCAQTEAHDSPLAAYKALKEKL